MAAGFEYFNHLSSGAPVLNGTAGSFIGLLDWALVAKGGWDKAFSGTNLAAYRSQTGTRCFLRVDDTQADFARTRGFRSMTAISTGTNPYPLDAQVTVANYGVRKNDGTVGPRRYWGVRTNKYIFLAVEYSNVADSGAGYRMFFAFGDVPTLAEFDSHNSVIFASTAAPNTFGSFLTGQFFMGSISPSAVPGSTSLFISGSPDGSVTSPWSAACFPYGGQSGRKAIFSAGGRSFQAPVLIGSDISSAGWSGVYPRARLANVHALYGAAAAAPGDPLMPVVDLTPYTIGARQFLPIRELGEINLGSEFSTLLLEITDTDGAE